jgi:hypothetical protein
MFFRHGKLCEGRESREKSHKEERGGMIPSLKPLRVDIENGCNVIRY